MKRLSAYATTLAIFLISVMVYGLATGIEQPTAERSIIDKVMLIVLLAWVAWGPAKSPKPAKFDDGYGGTVEEVK